MFTNILVGTDGSEQALKAAGTAGQLARILGAKVTLVHVITPLSPTVAIGGLGVATIDLTAVEEHYWKVAQAILDLTEKAYLEEAGAPPERMVLTGRPSTTICNYAGEKGADLVIVGSAGSGVEELFMGSTADNICHQAPCPVLVVR